MKIGGKLSVCELEKLHGFPTTMSPPQKVKKRMSGFMGRFVDVRFYLYIILIVSSFFSLSFNFFFCLMLNKIPPRVISSDRDRSPAQRPNICLAMASTAASLSVRVKAILANTLSQCDMKERWVSSCPLSWDAHDQAHIHDHTTPHTYTYREQRCDRSLLFTLRSSTTA